MHQITVKQAQSQAIFSTILVPKLLKLVDKKLPKISGKHNRYQTMRITCSTTPKLKHNEETNDYWSLNFGDTLHTYLASYY